MHYLTGAQSSKQTPQSEPISGKPMVENNAGGYTFALDPWAQLDRFLILGAEGNTYYCTEHKMVEENAKNVRACIDADGVRTVNRIVEISEAGRAPKNDPAIFALAMACSYADKEGKRAAFAALSKVCRIGTHLFHFAQFVQAFRGWGRGLREAVASWYGQMPVDRLAIQLAKYQQRDGWSHRDLLRLSHPHPGEYEARNALYRWTVGKAKVGDLAGAPFLDAVDHAAKCTTAKELVPLIRQHRLPRECIPTALLTDAAVWDALLDAGMGMEALARNLGTMTKNGVFADRERMKQVTEQLGNNEAIRKSRLHPVKILAALLIYAAGKGMRGHNTWEPVQEIVDALDAAFYKAFSNVAPTGKRIMLALDVSGSMDSGMIAGVPNLTPRVGTAALAMVTAAVEKEMTIIGFCNRLVVLPISPRRRLDDNCAAISNLPFGPTDCAAPMLGALEGKYSFDAFIILTDNETWCGDVHPVQALTTYRNKTGIPAKLIVVGMTATQFSIADPTDAGMLDVVGFDTAVPELMADFIVGEAA